MTTLYNGSLYVEGLFSSGADGSVGVTSSDTILSLLNYIGYYTPNRVMMEIGGYNTTVGNWTTVYKYAMGYINNPGGGGGSYIIQACQIGANSYSAGAVPSPITITTLNLSGLTIDYGSLYVGNNQESAYYSVAGTYNYAPMHKYIYAGPPLMNWDGGKFAIAHNLVLQGQGLTWESGRVNIPGATIVIEGAKSSYASQSTDNGIYFNTSMGQKAVMDSYGLSVTGGNFRVAVGYAANNGIEISNSNITGYYAGGNGILFSSNQYYTQFHCTGNSGGHMIADYGFLWDTWNLTYNAYTNNRAWVNKNFACASSRIEMGQSRIQFYTGSSGATPVWTSMMNITQAGVSVSGPTFSFANAHIEMFNSNITGFYNGSGTSFGSNRYTTLRHVLGNICGFMVADYGFLGDNWNLTLNAFTNNNAWVNQNPGYASSRITLNTGSMQFYTSREGVTPSWNKIMEIMGSGITTTGTFSVAPAGGTVAFIDAAGMHLRSALEFKTWVWNTSTDGVNRLYFENNSDTIYNVPAGSSHQFRRGNSILNMVTIQDVNPGTQVTINSSQVANLTLYSSATAVSQQFITPGGNFTHYYNVYGTNPNDYSLFWYPASPYGGGWNGANGTTFRVWTLNVVANLFNVSVNFKSDGNITAAGNVTATKFVGNGSELTGVTASSAASAGYAISAGSAVTAGYATSAGFASVAPDGIVHGTYVVYSGNHLTFRVVMPVVEGLYCFYIRNYEPRMWEFRIAVADTGGGVYQYSQVYKSTGADGNNRPELFDAYLGNQKYLDQAPRYKNPDPNNFIFGVDNWYFGSGLGDVSLYRLSYRRIA